MARVLTSQGLAPESDDVLQLLKQKHLVGSIDSRIRYGLALINLLLSMVLRTVQEDQGVDPQDGGMNLFEFYLIMKLLLSHYSQCVIP